MLNSRTDLWSTLILVMACIVILSSGCARSQNAKEQQQQPITSGSLSPSTTLPKQTAPAQSQRDDQFKENLWNRFEKIMRTEVQPTFSQKIDEAVGDDEKLKAASQWYDMQEQGAIERAAREAGISSEEATKILSEEANKH